MSVDVAAVVVKPKLHQSNTTKRWQETLSVDAERAKRALDRNATFEAEQRMYHDVHGEGTVVAQGRARRAGEQDLSLIHI